MKIKPIWDKSRFSGWEKERRLWLRKLSLKEAVRLQENLLSSSLIWELRRNFFPDNPLSLKDSLRKNKIR